MGRSKDKMKATIRMFDHARGSRIISVYCDRGRGRSFDKARVGLIVVTRFQHVNSSRFPLWPLFNDFFLFNIL
jgi:hypothetical protein